MGSRLALVLSAVAVMVTSGANLANAQPPSNNTARHATEILTLGQLTEDTTTAGGHLKASCTDVGYMSHVVWFSFTAASTTQWDAGTYGSNYDTVLLIYEGNAKNQIACDDNSVGGGLSRYLLNVTSGVTYYFAVGSYDRSPGGSLSFGLGT